MYCQAPGNKQQCGSAKGFYFWVGVGGTTGMQMFNSYISACTLDMTTCTTHVLYILNNRARAFLNGILTEEDGIMETFEEIRQN